MNLRPYQQEAVARSFLDLVTSGASLNVMATGTGKTVVLSELVKLYLAMGKKCLVLAHREEIIDQTARKIISHADLEFGEVTVEMGKNAASLISKVVVGSVQTMKGKRLQTWPKDHFGLVVIDEAHHAGARTYRDILEYFCESSVLGVTATPERSDKKDIGSIFKNLSYEYGIQQGIEEGYLVPLKTKMVIVDGLDLKRVKVNKKAGDYSETSLIEEMTKKSNIWGVAKPLTELTDARRVIVFTTSVFHSEAIAEILNSVHPNSAVSVSGNDSDSHRKRALEDFRKGDVKYLINCQVFTEGVDIPEIDCVAVARPTQSKSLYMQMIGRGTRLLDGKKDCLIVDFTDNCENHSLITVFDIFDTGDIEDSVKATAAKIATELADQSVEEVLAKAKIIVENRNRAKAKEKVNYTVRAVDPFNLLNVYSKPGLDDKPLTERQEITISRMGIPTVVNGKQLTQREAGRIIGKTFARRDKGLSSFKQMSVLSKYGFDPTDISFDKANKIIKLIGNNGWKLPGTHEQILSSLGES